MLAPRPISLEEISARADLPLPQGARLHEASYYGRTGMGGPTFYAKVGLEPDTVRQFEEAFTSRTGEKSFEGSIKEMGTGERPVAWWPPADQRARVAVHLDERHSVRVAVVSSARHEALIYVLWRESLGH